MNLEIPASIKTWSQFGHPLLMWVLLGLSIYALYLGIQVRRTRSAEGDARKELIKGKFNLKHHQVGSILFALMVLGTIGAMAVTYINNGKLFVGPHLLVGLSMTGLISISAALSPYMQKGQDWARYTHIVLNISLLGLFGWQAVSGLEILQNIISKM
ncbi:DUF4079 domain-containing protein [Microseira wollei]|uniref:DUF4079 domain-containing protein n=1 Tax=Microseira wollei NIES-4236 TaxID=2530354 RepID=A0AAV3X8Q6_9CYAN|nr:DUF4079 domain-containing protein [Microseira wollei]GET36652.1 hypothetical protein MiSe_14040 [Microseira wollei NIES-4236]